MRVLIIGDVVARPGRIAVLERIQDLREQHAIDLAVMNAENVAGGFSITPSLAEELFAAGIDVMTSGNHIFDKREAAPYIERQPRLLRPANYPARTPGRGPWRASSRPPPPAPSTPVATCASAPSSLTLTRRRAAPARFPGCHSGTNPRRVMNDECGMMNERQAVFIHHSAFIIHHFLWR